MKAVKSFKKNYRKEEDNGENSTEYSQRDNEHLVFISSDDYANKKWFRSVALQYGLLNDGMYFLWLL